jgi:hypothetical protein
MDATVAATVSTMVLQDIPGRSLDITSYKFQAIGMFTVQPQSQVLKVFKYFILSLKEENLTVTRIIIHNDKNIPLTTHRANSRGTDSVYMKQLSRLLSHHGINQKMGRNDHLAVTIKSTNKATLKLEQGQSSEKA